MDMSLPPRPVIGVFVAKKVTERLAKQERSYDELMYAQAGNQSGVPLYFFSSGDINLSRQTINGWVLLKQQLWAYKPVPWPDFVYNQAKGKASRETKAIQIRSDGRLHWLNEVRSHRKWKTHTILKDSFRDLLPHTTLGKGAKSLERMLSSYPIVLTKPTNGTWGAGICKVWRNNQGSISVQTATGDEEKMFGSVEQAYQRTVEVARNRPIIIQQFLDLFTIDSKPSDLRLMLVKDGNNQWQVLQWYLRISRPGTFVTNWHQGGSYTDVQPAWIQAGLSPVDANRLFESAKQIAIPIAQALEKAKSGRMLELGLDFAVDRSLRLWLLEANGWPQKGYVAHDIDPIPKIYSFVVEHAKFLWNAGLETQPIKVL